MTENELRIEELVPVSLDEITELAVPKMCPITAKPYDYRTEGRTVIIDYSTNARDKPDSRIEFVVE
jgi:hypothetical protein